jgi:sigma-E factor negative regulatory protein RseA
MEKLMLNEPDATLATREQLSALADGELAGTTAAQVCGHWQGSADARATWHAYQLIGDVLRSDDLATDPASDAAFLLAFRSRLSSEPVVLAPRLLPVATAAEVPLAAATRRQRWSWRVPTAVGAAFVAAAGVFTLTRPNGFSEPVTEIAARTRAPNATSASAPVRVASPPSSEAEPQTFVASGQVIRDARLDRYLAAHKQFAGSSALGVPSAYLRNAAVEVPRR